MELEVTYDAVANAAYIYLVPIGPGEAARQEVVDLDGPGAIILDFDRSGQVIGVEILNARALLPSRFLDEAISPGQSS